MPISTSSIWRRSAAHLTLASTLSSLLLHHHNPLSLLRSNPSLLPFPFPSSLLRRVLTRTHSNPTISLRFFLFATSHLSFSPTLLDLSTIFSILVDAGHLSPAARIFSPALRSHPANAVLDYVLRASSTCNISHSKVLSFVLELYSKLPSYNAMEVFKKMRDSGLVPSSRSLNALLNMLSLNGEIRPAWILCAAALHLGAELDDGCRAAMVLLLCKEDKVQRAEMLLNSGFSCRPSTYDLVVDCYARKGEFRAAAHVLKTMEERGLRLKVTTLSSVLEESCRLGNVKIAGIFTKEMIVRVLFLQTPSFDFDKIIINLCHMGKTFAAMIFFNKAKIVNFDLDSASYVSLLQALSQNGRQKEAMKVFDIMSQKGITVHPECLDVFVSGICKGDPLEEADAVIKNAMKKGFLPKASSLSSYVAANCRGGRWKEAAELLNLALDNCILMEAFCCSLLIKHFCEKGFLDSAVGLKEKMEGLGGFLDADSYNALLEGLVGNGRVKEGMRVLDRMREKKVVSSLSFVIMIHALCYEKEMRKAMNLHDEMMKLGLKPEIKVYRRLIAGFQ